MADVFLSYKKVDKARVVALARALETEGFTVWWDHELETGQKWIDRILEEVDIARALVGVWSVHSVQRGQFVESLDSHNYLLTEHMRAGARKVLGALYDRGAVPSLYVGTQVADLLDWDGTKSDHPGFRDLVAALESKAVPPFAERRILEARGETQKALEELHRARVQADSGSRRAEGLVRELAEAKERAERLTRELGTAKARLQAASGWEAREDALRRSLAIAECQAQDLQQAREESGEAARRATAADSALVQAVRERDAALIKEMTAEAVRAKTARERDEAVAQARGAAAQAHGAAARAQGLAALGWGGAVLMSLLWAGAGAPGPVHTDAARAAPAPEPPAPFQHAGSEWAEDDVVGWMRRIPAGTFTMGSPPSEGGDSDEQRQHEVTVSAFWLMESEVTKQMWLDVTGSSPSTGRGCPDCPVEQVSWDDAQAFITRLNQRTGKAYRLATEAEWEYAARGNESFLYAGAREPGAVAWYDQNSGGETHPVCGVQRNGYGLCDMSGNVWEWCLDGKRKYTEGAVTDPRGPMDDRSGRVYRGGSWDFTARDVRVANRDWWPPSFRFANLGLRLVRPE